MPIGELNLLPLSVWPVRLEYFSAWSAMGLFALLGLPIVLLGMRSLTGMGRARKWVAIGIRLVVILLVVLILGGLRFQRTSKDLEVMVLRDISTSTGMVQEFPGKSLPDAIDGYLKAASEGPAKPPDDKIGEISFQQDALIDALPNAHLTLNATAIRGECTGTNIAAAVQLGLATMQKDAMHRLLLITDGNGTAGDLDAAVNAAVAQHVPIDVMPLHYDVQHEVLMDRIVAPSWKRENEPFTLTIFLKSTNDFPVTGKLTVLHQGVPMDLDPATPGIQPTRQVTLNPPKPGDKFSITRVEVKVPPLQASGVHQFHASFEADQPNANVAIVGQKNGTGKGGNGVDTLSGNNSGDAFTYVQGKGRILYVDDAPDDTGVTLGKALNEEGIQISDADHIKSSEFPSTLIELHNYDAIILANVRYGADGLSEQQQSNLAAYVHDLGGGLVMIGGPDTFGAGGWQGKKLEEVLPVSMDIPATRQIPKGALVMVMHSCEFPSGNYYGEQCAIKAIETLSSQDEIGIVSFGNWGGTSQWDFPLSAKGDGSKPIAAAKHMQVGDMPSFEDSMEVALKGGGGNKGLVDSDAAQKHVIIISDGDPAAPSAGLVADYNKAKVSVSTINVYPHDLSQIAPTLKDIAHELHGKAYGPISENFNVLPQIFVKEASVVRRTLISENRNGIPLHRRPSSSEMVKGLGDQLPAVLGMVLTSRKNNPQIQLPITAGVNNDPLLASWQTGLGRAAVFTSDATNKWGVNWVGSPDYNKLWAQVVRGVAKPPTSNQFEVHISQDGTKAHITVEGTDKDTGFMNFLNVSGNVVTPDPNKTIEQHLVQTGPGVYEGDFDMSDTGTYVTVLKYRDQAGNEGFLPVVGTSMNSSPELRDLQSNDALLKDIADRTGGRELPPFDAEQAGLFSRDNLAPAVSSLPIWDRLIPVLLALILIDIAARRIAWDWVALKRYFATSTGFIRSFTTTRKVETRGSLDALQRVRSDTAKTPTSSTASTAAAPAARPDPKVKFEAKGVAGNITDVVGGATDKPIPSAPKKVEPKGGQSAAASMDSLMEAKRRAQQKIRDQEKGQ